ncbi:unnamed protein product [Trichogramma brassicae]|uniref:Secreted protein n=1 Tax=Trichogramma brassicae TaxID=86971 RepID=A0A6H5IAH3_9HYME|nr:unnamed protein product [Trichogramma brassicae]
MSLRVNIELVLILLSVPMYKTAAQRRACVFFKASLYREQLHGAATCAAAQHHSLHRSNLLRLSNASREGFVCYTIHIIYLWLCNAMLLADLHACTKAIVQPASSSLHASREHSTEVLHGCSGSEPRSMHIRCRCCRSLSKPSIGLANKRIPLARAKWVIDRAGDQYLFGVKNIYTLSSEHRVESRRAIVSRKHRAGRTDDDVHSISITQSWRWVYGASSSSSCPLTAAVSPSPRKHRPVPYSLGHELESQHNSNLFSH